MFGHNYIVLLEKASVSQTMIELCHGCIITSKWYILIIIIKNRAQNRALTFEMINVMHTFCLLYDLFCIAFSKYGIMGLWYSKSQVHHQVQLEQTCLFALF